MTGETFFCTNKSNGIIDKLTDTVLVFSSHEDEKEGKKYVGLWDTGAGRSGITQRVAEGLSLETIRKQYVSGAHGGRDEEIYQIAMRLPINITFDLEVSMVDLSGAPGIDVLIGMDIIKHGDFSVTNYKGTTEWSFRMPSRGHLNPQ